MEDTIVEDIFTIYNEVYMYIDPSVYIVWGLLAGLLVEVYRATRHMLGKITLRRYLELIAFGLVIPFACTFLMGRDNILINVTLFTIFLGPIGMVIVFKEAILPYINNTYLFVYVNLLVYISAIRFGSSSVVPYILGILNLVVFLTHFLSKGMVSRIQSAVKLVLYLLFLFVSLSFNLLFIPWSDVMTLFTAQAVIPLFFASAVIGIFFMQFWPGLYYLLHMLNPMIIITSISRDDTGSNLWLDHARRLINSMDISGFNGKTIFFMTANVLLILANILYFRMSYLPFLSLQYLLVLQPLLMNRLLEDASVKK